MEIEIIGNVTGEDFGEKIIDKLEEVVASTSERLEDEKEVKVTGATVTKALFTVGLNVEGIEEPQLLTVEHHKGIPEMFKWVVDYNDQTEMTNETGSAYDSWTVAKAQGQEQEFETIESAHNVAKMELEGSEDFGNMTKDVYLDGLGNKIVQIMQDGRLIQELKLVPKPKEDEDTAK